MNDAPITPSDIADASSPLRVPPHNYEAERALLGAILMNNKAYERVADLLDAAHFADPVNGRIYQACATLILRGEQANPVTLKTALESDELVKGAGGMKYLATIAASAVTVINAGEYGALIVDLFRRREFIAAGIDFVNGAFDRQLDTNTAALWEEMQAAIDAVIEKPSGRGVVAIGALLSQTLEDWERDSKAIAEEKPPGIPTGLIDLDKRLGGLCRTDLYILAGRPSMGKTALALTIAYNAAAHFENNEAVAFFSSEMSGTQLASRLLTARTRVRPPRLDMKAVTPFEMGKAMTSAAEMSDLGLLIEDASAITLSAIRTRLRQIKRKRPIGLVIVDYLQIMGIERGVRLENEVVRVSYLSAGLKAIAKDFDVPVLALSQLSREVEKREDKRPQLSDLRASGSIEQDADAVIFVYREEYYLERAGEPQQRPEEDEDRYHDRYVRWQSRCDAVRGIAEAIVAKHRHGPIGKASLYFDADRTWFENLERRT